jgi:hypothetical protein
MKAVQSEQRAGPEIVESYHDFEPPADFRKLLENLLDAVPAKYLVGLKTIVLANQSALTRDQRRQKIWSRNRKIRLAEARGAYYAASRNSSATVWLYVDNILRSEDPRLLRMPILRYGALATVLYHEIGHHIHAAHRPVFEGKEDVVEEWSRILSGRFYRRRFWYLVPVLYPLALVRKLTRKIKKTLSEF